MEKSRASRTKGEKEGGEERERVKWEKGMDRIRKDVEEGEAGGWEGGTKLLE